MIIKKLPEICEIKTGKKDANHANPSGKYRFYTCASQYSMCDTFSFSGESIIVPGNGDIGLVFYYNGDFEAYQRTYVLNNIKISPKYLYYHLVYKWRHINSDKQYGSTVRYVRMSNFTSYELPVPSLDEQERIVARIEELFSELDNGVETLRKTKQQLAVYRQAVLKQAFNTKDTATVEISQIVDDIRIGPFGTMLHKSDYISDGIPVINPQHIKNNIITAGRKVTISSQKAEELTSYRLRCNDIVMGRRGEMGRCAAVTEKEHGWICGTGSIMFRLKADFDALFYAQILSSPDVVHYLEENATGTTMKNLNEEIVKHIPVPYITRQQQKTVSQKIDAALSVCDSIEKTVDTALQQAEAMRQSILKKAFEGKL